MTDLVRRKRAGSAWETTADPDAPGASAAFVYADTSSSPSIPNNGTPTVVTFDDGVIHQDGTDLTLNADQQHFDIAADGYYIATFVALFAASDPTGVRLVGITVPQDLGQAVTQFPGDDAASGGAQAFGTITVAFRAFAGDSAYAIVAVKGAAGAVSLDYAEMSVTRM